ncbi:MAG TPA: class I SAM-dependent methyltransferase [Dehalococcoidia bacterium]
MAEETPRLDEDVAWYYERGQEQERLTGSAIGRVELERTREILSRFLPPSGVVLDVGGAAGVYAAWLAERGYRVELFDPVPLHVEQARAAAAAQPHAPFTAEPGDARALPRPDAYADAVLLLGPLYHLQGAADRARALAEARRVLRPGGVLAAAGISRFAAVADWLARDVLLDPASLGVLAEHLATGRHRNPERRPGWFTTAYFHRPEELAAEVAAAGFAAVRLLAVESWAAVLPDLEARAADPQRWRRLLDAVRLVEEEPALLGMTGHLLAVGQAV